MKDPYISLSNRLDHKLTDKLKFFQAPLNAPFTNSIPVSLKQNFLGWPSEIIPRRSAQIERDHQTDKDRNLIRPLIPQLHHQSSELKFKIRNKSYAKKDPGSQSSQPNFEKKEKESSRWTKRTRFIKNNLEVPQQPSTGGVGNKKPGSTGSTVQHPRNKLENVRIIRYNI